MRTGLWIAAAVCALTCQLAVAKDGPTKPKTLTRSNPAAAHHSKASSYAPRPHSKHQVYGAPVGAPIVGYVKPAAKKTTTGTGTAGR
jgi:hypothetical protein